MPYVLIASLLSLVGFVIARIDGSVDEAAAGVGVALAIVVAALAVGLAPLARLAQRPMAAVLVIGFGALAAAAAMLPVLETLFPGQPAAAADLHQVGDALALAAPIDGPARVLVHAQLPDPPARLALALRSGEVKLHAELETTRTSVRLGRRGRGTAVAAHDSTFIDANLRGAKDITLASASGVWPVPLHVEVFREWQPDWVFWTISVLLLCLAAFAGASTGLGARVAAGVGCALFFGATLHYMATPDTALRPEAGALIVALFATTVAAPVLTAIGERLTSSAGSTATAST